MRLGLFGVVLATAAACGPSTGGDPAGDGGQTSSGGDESGPGASGSESDAGHLASTGADAVDSTGADDTTSPDDTTSAGDSTSAGGSSGAPEDECVSGTWRGRYETFVFGDSFTVCGQDETWIAERGAGGPDLIYCEYVFLEVTGEVCPEVRDGEEVMVLQVEDADGPCELPPEVACSDDELFCYDGFDSSCTYDCDLHADECPEGFYCGVQESSTISATFCYAEQAPVPLGEPCVPGGGACGPGAACLSSDGLTEPVCHALCNPEEPDPCEGAGPCVACTAQPDVGVCGDPTPPACAD